VTCHCVIQEIGREREEPGLDVAFLVSRAYRRGVGGVEAYLDAPVECVITVGPGVWPEPVGLTIRPDVHAIGRHAEVREELADGVGAPLTELGVVGMVTARVGMPDELDPDVGEEIKDMGDGVEHGDAEALNVGPIEGEVYDVRHGNSVHDCHFGLRCDVGLRFGLGFALGLGVRLEGLGRVGTRVTAGPHGVGECQGALEQRPGVVRSAGEFFVASPEQSGLEARDVGGDAREARGVGLDGSSEGPGFGSDA
jgi:hypothetical protein